MELGPSTLIGISLTIVGLILYLIRTKKTEVSRDYDLFFSSVGVLCGGILIFQGWRLDPILLLCQILSSGTAIFFIGESLWLRSDKYKSKTIPNKIFLNKTKETLKNKNPKSNYIKMSPYVLKSHQNDKLSPSSILISNWELIDYTETLNYKNSKEHFKKTYQ